ncbi:MAG: hypothetical protein EBX41_03195 [Chitinophagia bacterium]|nr:hypothetical protein [Chitinophagia bacterium]
MQIANPLNDVAFKWLMLNKRIAKFFLSTILQKNIIEVHPAQQEQAVRMDYIATIIDDSGQETKVMIEVQKFHHRDDITRFRHYIGNYYTNEQRTKRADGTLKPHIPLTVLYILGYKDPQIEQCIYKVEPVGTDQLTGELTPYQSEFISSLTHSIHIFQIPRIDSERLSSKLGQLLSVFYEAHKQSAKAYLLDYPFKNKITEQEVEYILAELNKVTLDTELRKAYDEEEEAYKSYYDTLEDLENQVAKQNKALEEKEKEIAETKQVVEEKDKAIELKEKVIAQNIMALEQKDRALEEERRVAEENRKALEEKDKLAKELQLNTARYMLSTGATIATIMEFTKLSEEEIEGLK